MNVNRLIVPAGVLMAAVLIILGGYVILNGNKPIESPEDIGNQNTPEDTLYVGEVRLAD